MFYRASKWLITKYTNKTGFYKVQKQTSLPLYGHIKHQIHTISKKETNKMKRPKTQIDPESRNSYQNFNIYIEIKHTVSSIY